MESSKEKQPQDKKGLARILELASGKKGLIVLSGLLSALASACTFVPYISVYLIIQELVTVYPEMAALDQKAVFSYAILAVGGIAANILLYFCALLCSHLAAFGVLYDLKLLFSRHISEIPLGYHLTIGSGRMRKIMDENIESIEGFIAHQLPDFVGALIAPLVMVVILLAVDWRFGAVSLLGIVLAFVAQFAGFNGKAKERMQKFQKSQEVMNSASVEYVRGMTEIKAFNQTADSFGKLKNSIVEYTDYVLDYALGWQNYMPAFTTIINNIYLLLIPVGILIGQKSSDYRIFSLNFLFYLLMTPAIAGVMNKIMYVSETFIQINGNVERMDDILHIRPLEDGSTDKKQKGHDIRFSQVSFSYQGEDVMALQDITFQAAEGRVTAVVGPSGGGKSTIASLISRFWDVTEGSISIGGVDIRDMPAAALMEQVSFVFQDIFLFKQSVRDNIRMGNPCASQEQVIAAAQAACCHDFIMKLPNGYDTVIGTRGVHLSGGERQRIAIARAILKDAPVLVLDEATAFSDPENEYLIHQAFEKLMDGKTVIIIAHRLSTVRSADQILVMEQGQIRERGNHEELIVRNGRYAQMWERYTETIQWRIGTGKAVAK